MKITNDIKLSKELIWKLKNLQGKIKITTETQYIEYCNSGRVIKTPMGNSGYVLVEIDLSDFPNSSEDLVSCKKWLEINRKWYSTSYKKISIDVGPFVGLHPVEIHPITKIILFEVHDFDFNPTWRDWFITDEEED